MVARQMMLRLAPLILALAAQVGMLWWAYSAGADSVQSDWDAEKIEQQAAVVAAQKAHRAQEQQWRGKVHDLQERLTAANTATLGEVDTTITSLRGDNLRLRERFRACSSRVPGDTGAAPGDDASSQNGLSKADAEFLIREAARADAVANRLEACQSFVAAMSPR